MTNNNSQPKENKCKTKSKKKMKQKVKAQNDMSENQTSTPESSSLVMANTGLSNTFKLFCSLVSTLMSSLKIILLKALGPKFPQLKQNLKRKVNEMLTAMDKGIQAAQVATPPVGIYHGVDLRTLPKFVAFKAAMLKERMTLQYVLAVCMAFFTASFVISRVEIHTLETKLREKEYILAPGVMDFTPASPQSVSDSYVVNAAMSFLAMLGNINAANIDEQYKRLASFMTPELRIQFEEEIREWKDAVKAENISEILRLTDREVVASGEGYYNVTAIGSRERYSNSESMGREDEVIQMTMRLVAPVKGKEWYLEIVNLKRKRAEGFKHESPNSKVKTSGK